MTGGRIARRAVKMHYSQEEWRRFRLNQIGPGLRGEMADHLAECGSCLDTYLSIIEERDLELAEIVLAPHFTDSVMRRVRALKRAPTDARRRGMAFSPMQNYVLAAAITAVLFGAGWFDALPRAIPLAVEETILGSRDTEVHLPVGWVSGLASRVSDYLAELTRCGDKLRGPVRGDGQVE